MAASCIFQQVKATEEVIRENTRVVPLYFSVLLGQSTRACKSAAQVTLAPFTRQKIFGAARMKVVRVPKKYYWLLIYTSFFLPG